MARLHFAPVGVVSQFLGSAELGGANSGAAIGQKLKSKSPRQAALLRFVRAGAVNQQHGAIEENGGTSGSMDTIYAPRTQTMESMSEGTRIP